MNQKFRNSVEKSMLALVEIRDRMQDYFDERSERWQDSDAGQEYEQEITTLDNAIGELETII